jgi:tRNA-dihydrouridine synthase B
MDSLVRRMQRILYDVNRKTRPFMYRQKYLMLFFYLLLTSFYTKEAFIIPVFLDTLFIMTYWTEKIKIGHLTFPRFIGGPLDGITDSPFRQLVREFSKEELLYTEMRHVACVTHDKGALKALHFQQFERPLSYQVAANRVDFIAPACEKIMRAGVDIIDLNIGCPAKNVVNSGSGSSLMADCARLEVLLKEFRKRLSIPFTVKIRAGFKHKNALDIAKLAQDCGVDALAIHPRLQTQRFEGRPDYELAAQVKKAVSIPVIISGGVVNWMTARLIYEQTGVDGYLIGRGLWAKPWKLYELQEHAAGRSYAINNAVSLAYAQRHLDLMMDYYGPKGLYNFRKHLPFYLRGLPEAAALRADLVTQPCVETVRERLQKAAERFSTVEL